MLCEGGSSESDEEGKGPEEDERFSRFIRGNTIDG